MVGRNNRVRQESMLQRLAQVLARAEVTRLSNAELARRAEVHVTTARRHRAAAERWLEQDAARPVTGNDMQRLERLLLELAQAGNMAAARLLFLRHDKPPAAEVGVPSIAELEEALAMLKAG